MLFTKIITITGIAIVADVAYLILKNLESRFYNTFSLLMFGEKFSCSVVGCRDPSCSYHNEERIAMCIQSAQYTLDICMYMLTNRRFCAYILAAHHRKVDVRIITDVSNGMNIHLQTLRRAGIPIGWVEATNTGLMHHKFCIIDGRPNPTQHIINKLLDKVLPPIKSSRIITGSLNWTQSAVQGNYENVIITNDPVIVQQYQDLYDDIAGDFFPIP